jgi:hypothetical protein
LAARTADNKSKSFELVSTETWNKNIDGIKRYYINNSLNYKFLISNEEVSTNYQVRGVPAFYVLNENKFYELFTRPAKVILKTTHSQNRLTFSDNNQKCWMNSLYCKSYS